MSNNNNPVLCSNFCGSEGEQNHELTLSKKYTVDDLNKMQAIRNLKKLGESENIEHSAKNVKTKPHKHKMKKAKKMKPLSEETEEDLKDNMMSSDKYTVSSHYMTTQSKFGKSTGMKVMKQGNSMETTKQTKIKKPLYSNNEFSLEKSNKKNINSNNNEITEDGNGEGVMYSENEKRERTVIKTDKSNKINHKSMSKKKKNNDKTENNENTEDFEINDTEFLNNNDNDNNDLTEKKKKRKSKSKSKKKASNKEAVDYDKLREFKASTVDAVDSTMMINDNVSQHAKERKIKKKALKEADVEINPNHDVVMLGEVKKPNNLNVDSVIVSSKVNKMYQGPLHFGGFGLDSAYSKLSKKKIDVDYDANVIYGKPSNTNTINKDNTSGRKSFTEANNFNPNLINNNNNNKEGNTIMSQEDLKQPTNLKYSASNNNNNVNNNYNSNNENSTDNTINASKQQNTNNKYNKQSNYNTHNQFFDNEYNRNNYVRNEKKLENMLNNKERGREASFGKVIYKDDKDRVSERKHNNNNNNSSFKLGGGRNVSSSFGKYNKNMNNDNFEYSGNANNINTNYNSNIGHTKELRTRVANNNYNNAHSSRDVALNSRGNSINRNFSKPNFKSGGNNSNSNANNNVNVVKTNPIVDNSNFAQLLSISNKEKKNRENNNFNVNNDNNRESNNYRENRKSYSNYNNSNLENLQQPPFKSPSNNSNAINSNSQQNRFITDNKNHYNSKSNINSNNININTNTSSSSNSFNNNYHLFSHNNNNNANNIQYNASNKNNIISNNANNTGRFVTNNTNHHIKSKDNKSCSLCEKIYKETILNNKTITLAKCGSCFNQINLDSLEYYMKKYHDDLIKSQKKKLQTVIDKNLFSLKDQAMINSNMGWIESEKAKNDKIIKERMKMQSMNTISNQRNEEKKRIKISI